MVIEKVQKSNILEDITTGTQAALLINEIRSTINALIDELDRIGAHLPPPTDDPVILTLSAQGSSWKMIQDLITGEMATNILDQHFGSNEWREGSEVSYETNLSLQPVSVEDYDFKLEYTGVTVA